MQQKMEKDGITTVGSSTENKEKDVRVVNGRDYLDPSVLVVNCTSRSKEPWCHGFASLLSCRKVL